ncbi:MAG: hypothetical protein U0797_26345 [Gemmataceae bacterium]
MNGNIPNLVPRSSGVKCQLNGHPAGNSSAPALAHDPTNPNEYDLDDQDEAEEADQPGDATDGGEPDEPEEPTGPPELALAPNLLDIIADDLAAIGLVGERENGLLVYLCYCSRKLAKPLSPIIRGPSGSGKDELARRPADLVPPEDVVDAMRITPQALYHGEPGWLEHKLVLGGERSHQEDDAQRDRTAAIRQMLSHGYITKAIVVEGRTRHIRQGGPICYSETTTKASVFDEDLNRCVQLYVDDSEEQTRRVLQAVAARHQPGEKPDRQAIKEKHWGFQRWLRAVDVAIPFADCLAAAMPTSKVRVRRVFGQLLGLIQVVAFLHQAQRESDDNGHLIATIDDYGVARRLLLGPLHRSIGRGDEHARTAELLAKLPQGEFSTTEYRIALGGMTRKVASDQLNGLVARGLVRLVARGKGSVPDCWEVTSAPDDLLPTPEQLLEEGEA